MHVFIGGANNGKRKFVTEWLERQGMTDVSWCSGELPKTAKEGQVLVIDSIEDYLCQFDLADEIALATEVFSRLKQLDPILILTDMGRGVVPMNKETRQLRDVCGRLYQLLFKESEHVTRIWYGLSEKLK